MVDPKREREGRAKAFLGVARYAALHDKFKGAAPPPTAALEKELIALGVASTLAETDRRVLERSADQAGFYESGRDRLVMPGFVQQEGGEADGAENGRGGGGSSGSGGTVGGSDLELDQLLIALLKKIPP